MHAIILAAGEGMRLRPLTTYMPKVMLPVGNKPIMEYVIDALRENDVKDITIVVGYHADKVKQYFGNGTDFGVKIKYALQRKQIGTAHALYQAKMDGEFLLLYGDNMIDAQCVREILQSEVNTILGVRSEKPFRYGIIERGGKNIIKLVEKRDYGEAVVFTGLGHFESDIFRRIEEMMQSEIYDLPGVLNAMDIEVKVSNCGWRDALYPWDLLDLNSVTLSSNVRRIAGKVEESNIIGNVEIGSGTRIGAGSYIYGNVKIGENCNIGPNTVIMGDTSIGDGVEIGAFGYIENSIIMGGTKIGVGSVVKNSVIGREVAIGDKFVVLSGNRKRIFVDEIMSVNGGAIVCDGATIGAMVVVAEGCIVGADSRIGSMKFIRSDLGNGERVV